MSKKKAQRVRLRGDYVAVRVDGDGIVDGDGMELPQIGDDSDSLLFMSTGTVIAMGPDATGLRVGARVVVGRISGSTGGVHIYLSTDIIGVIR